MRDEINLRFIFIPQAFFFFFFAIAQVFFGSDIWISTRALERLWKWREKASKLV